MKRTPGPWEVRMLNPDNFCEKCVHEMDGGYQLNQHNDLSAPNLDEVRGNELLFSATPELLEACIEARKLIKTFALAAMYSPTVPNDSPVLKVMNQLTAALLKARGE